MPGVTPVSDLETLARSLDALIEFADQQKNFVLAATLDAARIQFVERYGPFKS